jgi:hypothetical protein
VAIRLAAAFARVKKQYLHKGKWAGKKQTNLNLHAQPKQLLP